MILDTDFLLDLIGGEQPAFQKGREMYQRNEDQRISVISVFELFYGAHYTQDEEEMRKVENLLLMYDVIDNDEDISKEAAKLLADADRAESTDSGVDNEDAIIGATANTQNDTVLTRNRDDFSKLGVEFQSYQI